MNLERAIPRASSVPGRKSAARLYNEIEYELALGEPDDHLECAGEQALVLLEDRFSGVRDAARQIEEPPGLSRRASDALDSIGQTTPRSRPPTRRRRTRPRRASRWSLNRLYEQGLAHPLLALAGVALSIVVIVHFVYVVLGAIALSALTACAEQTSAKKERERTRHRVGRT